MRLFAGEQANWQNRAHFFAAVAREMRHCARGPCAREMRHPDAGRLRARAKREKRCEGNVRISLSDVHAAADARDEDLVALDEALSRLEQIDPRASRIVELRFFTGLSERETAEALKISISTLKRDWNFAKAWLFDQLSSPAVE